ncbi:patatin-like phospholipase family protein [Marinobacterium mangrovicola]|uniref:NTE family protein n=1 Tax=Marinobacterium mangrovicola TaxID=1476959 RepID=A0A4R1GLK2_9GAMM|nr:patatin-like phospholipase family protein [Marinobacterium mangrovicola]TCK09457.1 NTE family protein [Marinobacterium mangrovicola]
MATVSLVLGAGGARGYAHIGVIAELEARGYSIVGLSGCSMGAVVGGLYAAGGLEDYRRWAETLRWIDVVRLLDLSFRDVSVRGDKVFGRIREMIGDPDIESLPIGYTAIATDLHSSKEIWFRHGSLLAAMRASVAIPGIVTPIVQGGRLLVDGGVLNPLPIVAAVAQQADLIIAVDVNARQLSLAGQLPTEQLAGQLPTEQLEDQKLNQMRAGNLGRAGILLSTIEVMQSALTKYKIAGYSPDLVIRVPKDIGGFHEFHRAKALIDAGREMARRHLDAFEQGDLEPGIEFDSVDQ